jgi:hypothetical protein
LKVCLHNAAPFDRKYLPIIVQMTVDQRREHRVAALICVVYPCLWLYVLMVRRQWWYLRCYCKINWFCKFPSQIKSKGSTLQLPVSVVDFLAEVSPVGVNIRHWIEGWMVSLILPPFHRGERVPHPFDRRVAGPRASGMNAVVERFFPSTPGIELPELPDRVG